jgi:uncharacterized membrane protein YeaQ/YmgE (transglycosylase-associated protein family)
VIHMIGQALVGLVVGVVAKLLLPVGRLLGWYEEGHPAGFVMSVVGAMVLLLAYRFIA